MCRRLRRKLCKRDAKRTVLEEAQSRSGDGRQSKRGRQRPGAAGLETLVDRAHAHHEFRGRVGDRKTTMPATQGFSAKTQASGMAQSLGNERGTTEGGTAQGLSAQSANTSCQQQAGGAVRRCWLGAKTVHKRVRCAHIFMPRLSRAWGIVKPNFSALFHPPSLSASLHRARPRAFPSGRQTRSAAPGADNAFSPRPWILSSRTGIGVRVREEQFEGGAIWGGRRHLVTAPPPHSRRSGA